MEDSGRLCRMGVEVSDSSSEAIFLPLMMTESFVKIWPTDDKMKMLFGRRINNDINKMPANKETKIKDTYTGWVIPVSDSKFKAKFQTHGGILKYRMEIIRVGDSKPISVDSQTLDSTREWEFSLGKVMRLYKSLKPNQRRNENRLQIRICFTESIEGVSTEYTGEVKFTIYGQRSLDNRLPGANEKRQLSKKEQEVILTVYEECRVELYSTSEKQSEPQRTANTVQALRHEDLNGPLVEEASIQDALRNVSVSSTTVVESLLISDGWDVSKAGGGIGIESGIEYGVGVGVGVGEAGSLDAVDYGWLGSLLAKGAAAL